MEKSRELPENYDFAGAEKGTLMRGRGRGSTLIWFAFEKFMRQLLRGAKCSWLSCATWTAELARCFDSAPGHLIFHLHFLSRICGGKTRKRRWGGYQKWIFNSSEFELSVKTFTHYPNFQFEMMSHKMTLPKYTRKKYYKEKSYFRSKKIFYFNNKILIICSRHLLNL